MGVGKAWLEHGGVYVVANIRGGGEFGSAWHNAGIREHKKRAQDDFAAIAADLVQRGVTSPQRLACHGGSNGGLLVGNMLTRYPERFGAVWCTIPLLDMRRYSKLLAGASWIAEYGDPDKPDDWAFLKQISPYHLAEAGKSYPPILLWTSARDDRVHPGHARKMAARLEALGHTVFFYEPPRAAMAPATLSRPRTCGRSAMPSCGRPSVKQPRVSSDLRVIYSSSASTLSGRMPPSQAECSV
jgi:prolyl oligopeptidase